MSGDPALTSLLVTGGLPDDAVLAALLAFARRLTLQVHDDHGPAVARLLALGWTPREVHDAVQVAAYFNYVNRLAEGLGVELEDYWARNR